LNYINWTFSWTFTAGIEQPSKRPKSPIQTSSDGRLRPPKSLFFGVWVRQLAQFFEKLRQFIKISVVKQRVIRKKGLKNPYNYLIYIGVFCICVGG